MPVFYATSQYFCSDLIEAATAQEAQEVATRQCIRCARGEPVGMVVREVTSEWIDWNGDEAGPGLYMDDIVQIETRIGVSFEALGVDEVNWNHLDTISDVIRYRLVALYPRQHR
jgi:hypothetical protein